MLDSSTGWASYYQINSHLTENQASHTPYLHTSLPPATTHHTQTTQTHHTASHMASQCSQHYLTTAYIIRLEAPHTHIMNTSLSKKRKTHSESARYKTPLKEPQDHGPPARGARLIKRMGQLLRNQQKSDIEPRLSHSIPTH